MTNLHPTIAAALAPFAPPVTRAHPTRMVYNDDDIYEVDVIARKTLRRIGIRSDYNYTTLPSVRVGCAALSGIQARSFCQGD